MNLIAMNDKDEIYEDPESTEVDESEDTDDTGASVEAAVKQEEEIVTMEAAAVNDGDGDGVNTFAAAVVVKDEGVNAKCVGVEAVKGGIMVKGSTANATAKGRVLMKEEHVEGYKTREVLGAKIPRRSERLKKMPHGLDIKALNFKTRKQRMAANDALPAVLVVNDDGIEAPGIKALVAVLGSAGFCRVFVCAPDVERSACAQSITIRETLEANLVEDYEGAAVAYSLTGTPADCASMGLSGQLFKGIKPLLVISGINKGANTGRQVIYSGTVAGAREAVIQGAPGISISLDWTAASTDALFSPAAATCLPLIRCVLEAATTGQLSSSGGDPLLLNVNVPLDPVKPKVCAAPEARGGDPLLLNVNVPLDPVKSEGFKLAQQGQGRVAFSWTHIAKKRTGVQLAGMSGALNIPLLLVPPSSILHSRNPQQGFKLAQQGHGRVAFPMHIAKKRTGHARVAFPWTHIAKKRTGVQLAGMGGAAAGGRGLSGMMGGRGLPGMMGGRGLPGMVGGRGLPGMTGPPAVSLAEIGSVASAAVSAHPYAYEGAARSKTPGEESKEDGGDEPWQPMHKMHFRHEPSGWDVLDKDPAFDSAALALGYVTVTPLAITASIDIQPRLNEDLAWLAPLLPHDA
ncbi:unnamed protein product [Closterium sp. Naga37s-1]|nr:unnamed protein product [Closterium sp. Naga37s-1]